MKKSVCFLFVWVVCSVFCVELPANFKICKRSDTNFDKCLTDALQDALPKLVNGLPEFNFPPIQPLEIPSATIGEGKGVVNMVQRYKNLKIYDIPLVKVENVHVSFNDTAISMEIRANADLISIDADYDFNGRILLLPITGNGQCHIKFKNTKVVIKGVGNFLVRKEEQYVNFDAFTVDLDPGKIDFKFENLFSGDETLSNEIHKIFDEQWKGIWEDMGSGYKEFLAIVVRNISNKIFAKVPFNKLFPL